LLVARAASDAQPSDERWELEERQRASISASTVASPAVLEKLALLEALPLATFREMGFQTSRIASEELLLRSEQPRDGFDYPLLEGRNIREFWQEGPRLFLRSAPDELRRAKCRLRELEDYRTVDFVVRQTAVYPIAALHTGLPFRNSLLAGFASEGLSALLLVGLLNSSLYRALHVAKRRDARQAAFPQVKIKHLRALPRPLDNDDCRGRLEAVARVASERGVDESLRAELDAATFELFKVSAEDARQVEAFLRERAPRSPRRI
jgi:hypothetical protein